MKEIKEKYLNFTGVTSEVPNDMPWGDTHWSSMNGTKWQQDGFGGTSWQDANLNASGDGIKLPGTKRGSSAVLSSEEDIINFKTSDRGSNAYNVTAPAYTRGSDAYNVTSPASTRGSDAYNVTSPAYTRGSDAYNVTSPASTRGSNAYTETEPHGYSNFLPSNKGQQSITLDHHQNGRPNIDLVLGDDDNSSMPDSDQWSNHPGFLGGTWWKDFWFPGKAEEERAAKAREGIDSRFPISGSCDVLTNTEARINSELEGHSKATKRGPKRVAKRNIPILNNKLKAVSANREVQCASEEQDQIQDDQLTMFMQQQMQDPKQEEGVSATNVILGLVIIGGLIWGISRLAKPTAPVAVAPVAVAPAG